MNNVYEITFLYNKEKYYFLCKIFCLTLTELKFLCVNGALFEFNSNDIKDLSIKEVLS